MKKVNLTLTQTADIVSIIDHLIRPARCRIFISKKLMNNLMDCYPYSCKNEMETNFFISEQTQFKFIPDYIDKEYFCLDQVLGVENKVSSDPEFLYYMS